MNREQVNKDLESECPLGEAPTLESRIYRLELISIKKKKLAIIQDKTIDAMITWIDKLEKKLNELTSA